MLGSPRCSDEHNGEDGEDDDEDDSDDDDGNDGDIDDFPTKGILAQLVSGGVIRAIVKLPR